MFRHWSWLPNRTRYSAGSYDPALPTAMFDFDSTLCPYKGTGPDAAVTLALLARLSSSFNLVIVSNRSSDTDVALAPLREYAAALDAAATGLATVYAPTTHSRFRKPLTGAWDHFVEKIAGGARPGYAFFCGDAAGRSGDFSASDYMFALNIGVDFITADAMFGFGGSPGAPPSSLGCLATRPDELARGAAAATAANAALATLKALPQPFLIIMVGSPASGKSHLSKVIATARPETTIISADIHKAQYPRVLQKAIDARKSIIDDNTNPFDHGRTIIAKHARGYTIVICHVTTPKDLCFFLNSARVQMECVDVAVPAVAIHTYWKRLRVPAPTEEAIVSYNASIVEYPFVLEKDAPREITEYYYASK